MRNLPLKTLKDRVWRASRLMQIWKEWEVWRGHEGSILSQCLALSLPSGCPWILSFYNKLIIWLGFPGDSMIKNLPTNAGDGGSVPGSGRSRGEGNGNPLQFSCLGNPRDRGAWQATIHGFTKELDMTWWLNSNSHPISIVSLISVSHFFQINQIPPQNCGNLWFLPCWSEAQITAVFVGWVWGSLEGLNS